MNGTLALSCNMSESTAVERQCVTGLDECSGCIIYAVFTNLEKVYI